MLPIAPAARLAEVAVKLNRMEIAEAINYRAGVIALLSAAKLPTDDLPETLNDFWVMIEAEELIGVVGLETYGNYGLLRSLVVRPDYRNQNIAGKLLSQLESLAAEERLKAVFLLTETAPGYFSSKGYYLITRSEIPSEIQQSSEFSHVCPQSAIAMRKDLE